ncbi:MAG: EsaB/YukD family protein [Pseudomonadota bacterium]
MEADAQTVQVRVQVVDVQPRLLDLVVPAYLPAKDITARIARDAGLHPYWPDGRRRLYWLRARGRLLTDHENLGALGVVPGELVYLLPEPPAGSGVHEQTPDYPKTRGYAGQGALALLGSAVLVCAWGLGWGLALSFSRSLPVALLPGLALGFLTTNLARHAWGGRGNRLRVALTGFVLLILVGVLALAGPLFIAGVSPGALLPAVPGVLSGCVGVLVGWLAWWGPVEPLPPVEEVEAVQERHAVTTVTCGICGQQVAPEVRQECPHGCGRFFHVGCYQARMSVYRGDAGVCGICGQAVARR